MFIALAPRPSNSGWYLSHLRPVRAIPVAICGACCCCYCYCDCFATATATAIVIATAIATATAT
eukprot:16112673-Heterocapsa_arctica.AAC.1